MSFFWFPGAWHNEGSSSAREYKRIMSDQWGHARTWLIHSSLFANRDGEGLLKSWSLITNGEDTKWCRDYHNEITFSALWGWKWFFALHLELTYFMLGKEGWRSRTVLDVCKPFFLLKTYPGSQSGMFSGNARTIFKLHNEPKSKTNK